MINFNFYNPTNLIFGSGSLNKLGDQKMPGKKAMVLISNGKSTKENGYLDRTLEQLKRAGVETAVWAGIMENPLKDAIMEGASFAKENGCDEQFVKMARAMGIHDAAKPEDFITALVKLQEDCGVDDLKMSDYGIEKSECMALAVNARETMGGLFLANPCEMSDEDCAGIFEKAYR